MGAYAPARFLEDATRTAIVEKILHPILDGLRQEGIDYQGVLYAGLMLTPSGPQMLEINCRLGDPETQVVLPLLETSLVDIAQAVARRELDRLPLKFNDRSAVGIVLAAPGYPEAPRLGDPIEGLDKPATEPDRFVFHAGTQPRDGKILTSGGRVATVTAWGRDFETARRLAYEAVGAVRFPGAVYRRDLGAKAGVKA